MICWMNWENKEKYSERIVEYLYTLEYTTRKVYKYKGCEFDVRKKRRIKSFE